jgi:hypothetical protein
MCSFEHKTKMPQAPAKPFGSQHQGSASIPPSLNFLPLLPHSVPLHLTYCNSHHHPSLSLYAMQQHPAMFPPNPSPQICVYFTFACCSCRALITMFKLTCGDSWIDELPSTDEEGITNFGVVGFIMSYIVIAVWTVLQVI